MVPKLMACAFSISQESQGEVAGGLGSLGMVCSGCGIFNKIHYREDEVHSLTLAML